MATIYRRNDSCLSPWRVMIRRKGLPTFCLCFDTEREAQEWAKLNEPKYVLNHEEYIDWISTERLRLKREREFKGK